jgi:hypothetical protein
VGVGVGVGVSVSVSAGEGVSVSVSLSAGAGVKGGPGDVLALLRGHAMRGIGPRILSGRTEKNAR